MSCASGAIYRDAAWLDDPALLDAITTDPSLGMVSEPCAEIFPPHHYHRPTPALFGGDAGGNGHVAAIAHGVAQAYPRGPASVLVRLANACLSRTVLYLLSNDETRIVYETHRPEDRDVAMLRDEHELRLVDDHRRADPFTAQLWLGSTRNDSVAHWLLDDLPRLRALSDLRRLRPYAKIQILIPAETQARNLARAESCMAVCRSLEIENVELVLIDRDAKIFFDELYYVTPVTRHPGSKSPEALRFVADQPDGQPASTSQAKRRKIFIISGHPGVRELANQAEIIALLGSHGFEAVAPRTLPLPARMRLFREADCVIGTMDAAMAETVFCPDGCSVGYLAPEGCIEPFFWDLAAARGHRYAACFGHVAPGGEMPWLKNFRINPRDLEAMLAHLVPVVTETRRDPFQIWT